MDSDLIQAVRNREEWAFKQLITEHQTLVFSVCLSMVKNEEDAEDLAQEVFIDCFEKIDKFKGDSALSTWLYRMAVNKSLDQIRSQKRKKRWAGVKAVLLGADELNHPKDFDHPGVQLENKEHAKTLFEHIDQLADKQKIAFTLSKIKGLSYSEIADVMETSLSSVESLIFRANSNLRKSLESYYLSIKD
ncbi:MAG: sigma-70 family RNA polymerase sigma factor [Cyclobacteriaceae bacterium]